jgi:hypothetical protein
MSWWTTPEAKASRTAFDAGAAGVRETYKKATHYAIDDYLIGLAEGLVAPKKRPSRKGIPLGPLRSSRMGQVTVSKRSI